MFSGQWNSSHATWIMHTISTRATINLHAILQFIFIVKFGPFIRIFSIFIISCIFFLLLTDYSMKIFTVLIFTYPGKV